MTQVGWSRVGAAAIATTLVATSLVSGCAASGSSAQRPTARLPHQTHGPWHAVGDVDGDGRVDQARVRDLHRRERGLPEREAFRLVLHLSSHGMATADFGAQPRMPGTAAFAQTHVFGGTDITSDNASEIFVQDWRGASTAFMTIFRLVDHRLVQLTIDDAPVDLSVNGTVEDFFGFACRPPVLTLWGDGRAGAHHFHEEVRRYRVDGTALVLLSRNESRVGRPTSRPYISCGDLPDDIV